MLMPAFGCKDADSKTPKKLGGVKSSPYSIQTRKGAFPRWDFLTMPMTASMYVSIPNTKLEIRVPKTAKSEMVPASKEHTCDTSNTFRCTIESCMEGLEPTKVPEELPLLKCEAGCKHYRWQKAIEKGCGGEL